MVNSKKKRSARIKKKKERQDQSKEDSVLYPCQKCDEDVVAGGVYCVVCDGWWHFKCENTTGKKVKEEYPPGKDYICEMHMKEQKRNTGIQNYSKDIKEVERSRESSSSEEEYADDESEESDDDREIQDLRRRVDKYQIVIGEKDDKISELEKDRIKERRRHEDQVKKLQEETNVLQKEVENEKDNKQVEANKRKLEKKAQKDIEMKNTRLEKCNMQLKEKNGVLEKQVKTIQNTVKTRESTIKQHSKEKKTN